VKLCFVMCRAEAGKARCWHQLSISDVLARSSVLTVRVLVKCTCLPRRHSTAVMQIPSVMSSDFCAFSGKLFDMLVISNINAPKTDKSFSSLLSYFHHLLSRFTKSALCWQDPIYLLFNSEYLTLD